MFGWRQQKKRQITQQEQTLNGWKHLHLARRVCHGQVPGGDGTPSVCSGLEFCFYACRCLTLFVIVIVVMVIVIVIVVMVIVIVIVVMVIVAY